MFKYKHFIYKWYVDEKTSLRKEKHKWINKELIELCCLIKSVADKHFYDQRWNSSVRDADYKSTV